MITTISSSDEHISVAGQLQLMETPKERYSSVFFVIFKGISKELREAIRRLENQIVSNMIVAESTGVEDNTRKGVDEAHKVSMLSNQDSDGKEGPSDVPVAAIPMGPTQDAVLGTPITTGILYKVVKALSSIAPKLLESNDDTMDYRESDEDNSTVLWISFSPD